ncbi:hypothetical protein [Bacteroides acidifaciens]|uniref:hypothetical protein n=1 Tax=Bacteroides acidifaciens TaxID=85831 RepID=UPI0025B59FD6|nr:hypothetical protein [Bacteroides acidifaciens]
MNANLRKFIDIQTTKYQMLTNWTELFDYSILNCERRDGLTLAVASEALPG